jgi:two-component system response regulator FlrC
MAHASKKIPASKTAPVKARVLVVEDDCLLREAICDTLELAGFGFIEAENGEAALLQVQRHHPDMVVSDVNMPRMDGNALLHHLRDRFPQIPVLMVTAYGTVERAVAAMKNGAVDYLVKPFEPGALVAILNQVLTGMNAISPAAEPVAEEPDSKALLALARKIAQADSTVLITGESGTGKEVLARYIHHHSPRVNATFVAINCAAIPDNMLEATLFGHEKGAFTGAVKSAPGKFELANGGTLLLDEISEMDLGLQAKLLRVLQEREVERIGGRKLIQLDVRVIATSNQDLAERVQAGAFREDLYYRLCVFPLQWQPLRARPADILPLARRLIQVHARKMKIPAVKLSASACQALVAYPWPGNVRELDNALQRALILQQGNGITAADLCLPVRSGQGDSTSPCLSEHPLTSAQDFSHSPGHCSGHDATASAAPEGRDTKLEQSVRDKEFQVILQVLREESGRRAQTAERLGISPRTLRYKLARMRDHGMEVDNLSLAG